MLPLVGQVYQELTKKHPSFRERSENTDLAVEISLQPWKAFQPDGVSFPPFSTDCDVGSAAYGMWSTMSVSKISFYNEMINKLALGSK